MPVIVELWLLYIIMLFWETGCYIHDEELYSSSPA